MRGAPGDAQRHRRVDVGLDQRRHLAPLGDRVTTDGEHGIAHLHAGARGGLPVHDLVHHRRRERLDGGRGLHPLLERVGMDVKLQLRPPAGEHDGYDVASRVLDAVHDLVPRGHRYAGHAHDRVPHLKRAERFPADRNQRRHHGADPRLLHQLFTGREGEARIDQEREYRVHRDARQDDHHALPDRLRLEHAVGGTATAGVPPSSAALVASSSRLAILT